MNQTGGTSGALNYLLPECISINRMLLWSDALDKRGRYATAPNLL